MELVTNFGSSHRSAVNTVLEGANRAAVAVAFLKVRGASALAEMLTPVLEAGGKATVFVGTDFFLTEPDALKTLLNLSLLYSSLITRVGGRSKYTFHPKVYAGYDDEGYRCLTGSANLTGGALTTNVEASIMLRGAADDPLDLQLREFFDVLSKDARYRKLDALELARYRALWTPVEKMRKELEKAAAAAEQDLTSLPALDKLHKTYMVDSDAQAERKIRRAKRAIAYKVQKEIIRLGNAQLSTAKLQTLLRPLLNDLMTGKNGGRHLWASDAIFRKGSASIKMPKRTIELFAQAAAAAKLPVKEGYREVRDLALVIPGVGTNMVTEIMSTFAPNTYPVINGNTRAALAGFGLTFSGAHTLDTLKPERYSEVVEMIAGVRDRVGEADFAETDAFLNWVFQRAKRAQKLNAKT
ncbi:hypothetical protein GR210_26990 [Rhizobium leguminosarum]|uniref:phospholipase D family protein n=1 Tax=Rhizobium leguminosarum TaxID=384 RepID=UPI0013DBA27D|nr:phospholipase D family protein [Rhizobium leguminosarum]NEH52429.1 hypothetical protein [Rhizobium leguminosarum]